jgi:GMP synthase (glutamine-hydrolysing)
VPVLGICYGMQAMALQLGGRVAPGTTREYGRASIEILRRDGLFADLASHEREPVWMSHGDCVAVMPEGFEALARSDDGILAAMADESKRLYGLQFHPEVHHTPCGSALLRRFVLDLCGCDGSWTMAGFIDSAVQAIRATVGQGRILCALSGGIDSSVTAALLHRAIGDRLTCVFVDNGLLRRDEGAEVQRIFADGFHIPLVIADAAAEFLGALAGVTDPERKRKIIGSTFIDVFDRVTHAPGMTFDFLAQGTLYPDAIESVSRQGPSVTIKSHHNVGGLPERMRMRLVARRLAGQAARWNALALPSVDGAPGMHAECGRALAVISVAQPESWSEEWADPPWAHPHPASRPIKPPPPAPRSHPNSATPTGEPASRSRRPAPSASRTASSAVAPRGWRRSRPARSRSGIRAALPGNTAAYPDACPESRAGLAVPPAWLPSNSCRPFVA